MNTFLRKFLLKAVKTGNLTVISHDGQQVTLGDGTGQPVVLRLNSAQAERAIALDPYLKLGECFMSGDLDILEGTIYDLIMLAYHNIGRGTAPAVLAKALEKLRIAGRRLRQLNTRIKSRGNVKAHYDLSADLYRMFLDPDMQYSCAYYPTPETTLTEAELLKKRHIAAKLLLHEGQDILDIGCGWGGMGLYLARIARAKVDGVTLSDEQIAVAKRRVEREGLTGQVDFRIQDYRDISQTYDRIVSVGMFEHVGVNHYDTFFRKSASLLRKDGVMLLHTIGRCDPPGATNPFIQKYIFPGGYIPALSEIMKRVEKSGLVVTDVEVLRLHYAETLRDWRKAFMARRNEARELYDEAFCRLWEFYLAGSEATFREGGMVVFQLQLAHRVDDVPVTRDYITAQETAIARLEQERGLPDPAWPEDWPKDWLHTAFRPLSGQGASG